MQRITYRVKVSAQGAKRRISYLLRPTKRRLQCSRTVFAYESSVTSLI